MKQQLQEAATWQPQAQLTCAAVVLQFVAYGLVMPGSAAVSLFCAACNRFAGAAVGWRAGTAGSSCAGTAACFGRSAKCIGHSASMSYSRGECQAHAFPDL